MFPCWYPIFYGLSFRSHRVQHPQKHLRPASQLVSVALQQQWVSSTLSVRHTRAETVSDILDCLWDPWGLRCWLAGRVLLCLSCRFRLCAVIRSDLSCHSQCVSAKPHTQRLPSPRVKGRGSLATLTVSILSLHSAVWLVLRYLPPCSLSHWLHQAFLCHTSCVPTL